MSTRKKGREGWGSIMFKSSEVVFIYSKGPVLGQENAKMRFENFFKCVVFPGKVFDRYHSRAFSPLYICMVSLCREALRRRLPPPHHPSPVPRSRLPPSPPETWPPCPKLSPPGSLQASNF